MRLGNSIWLMLAVFVAAFKVMGGPSLVVAPPTGNVRIVWDYDTNQLSTNLWFNWYETTNLTTPLAQWNCVTNVIGTNLSVNLTISPGAHFFVGTASNFWGETSITSNLATTPPLPLQINDSSKIVKVP